MRGKESVTIPAPVDVRITPAYAGKSFRNRSSYTGAWDHPRVCGEKIKPSRDFMAGRGSPPRVRGKVKVTRFPAGQGRITPACAGKSTRSWTSSRGSGDHPRVCGEKRTAVKSCFSALGSPPRTQGKVTSRTQRALRSAGRPAPVPPLQTRIMVISPRP